MVDVRETVDIANEALYPFIGVVMVRCDDETVVTARHAVVYAVSAAHEIDRRIAALLHALGERDIVLIQLYGEAIVKDFAMVEIHARLDGRQRRIGILGRRKMPVKDCAA